MKDPLNKRMLRELRSEMGKYAVIAILLIATIGFVSGFLVAGSSMIAAYNEGFEKYNIEDGHFRVEKQLNRAQLKAITGAGVTLYDLHYRETSMENSSTLRIYPDRTQVNTVCLMQGAMPAAPGEMGLDRMYAENNGIAVGDTVTDTNGQTWTVTGYVALPDYSCLFKDNTDTMFDAIKFGVAIVTQEAFDALPEQQTWNYAWQYDTTPADDRAEKDAATDFMKVVNKTASLQDFVPEYENQAIIFTGDDLGSDRAMIAVLLYIVIAIMAFVFSVTTSNTIAKEAGVIGTLRASGYSRGELVRHGHAGGGHPYQRGGGQCTGVHGAQKRLRRHVLWQLQLAHLCHTLERRCVLDDDSHPGGVDDLHQLAGAFPHDAHLAAAIFAA